MSDLVQAASAWNSVRDRCAADGQRHLYQLVFSVLQGEEERRQFMDRAEDSLLAASGLDPEQHGIVWYRVDDDLAPGLYTMQAELLTKEWCQKYRAAEAAATPLLDSKPPNT